MLKKILIPFDGSDNSKRALEFAANLGQALGSEIIVVNVIVPYDFTKVPPRKPKNAYEKAQMEMQPAPAPEPLDVAKAYLDSIAYPNPTYRLIVDIDPAERILDFCKTSEPDLLVIGNRGMGLFAEILMGSVSMKIAQHATCPVVVIK